MNRNLLSTFVFGAMLILALVWVNSSQALQIQSPNIPEIDLGQTGLSFRYEETFGVTEQAYISDSTHHNYPYGVGTDGTYVWVAELPGRRAIKYASDGTYQGVQIGNAGHDTYQDQTIWRAIDVAVDSSGNVWIADSSPSHVLKFDANGDFLMELGETWTYGTDNDHFGRPVSIAFDSSGNIYVSDGTETWTGGNQRIQIFDSSGNYLNTIGETGVAGSDNNHFYDPHHIVIDDNNYLYVADFSNHRIQIFNVSNPLSPVYLTTLGVSSVSGSDNEHFNQPTGVAVDSNYIYVSDQSNRRIQIFNRTTGTFIATIGTGSWGTGNNEFKKPTDVAIDSAGSVYVADKTNNRVQQFDSDWDYVRTFGVTGVPYLTDGYHYNGPNGLAVTSDGEQYIMEGWGHRLVKIDANGDPLWTIGEAGVNGDDNQHFAWAGDVALDNNGNVYVADKANHRVQIFTSGGSYIATMGASGISGTSNNQFDNPFGLTIAPNDYIYVADRDNHRIQIFDEERNFVGTLGETGVGGTDNSHFILPEDVAVDGIGNIYVADSRNHRVQVYDAGRNYIRTLGVTGDVGDDFGHFYGPHRLAVDAKNNLYVIDTWNSRVQVFDVDGAYLTTIGGSNGARTGQLDEPYGIALDIEGNVYVANRGNSRIQKFASGVPGWQQVNINGFGYRTNQLLSALTPFGGQLYAGTRNYDTGAQLWRQSPGLAWTAVFTDGLGDANNVGVEHLIEFNGYLYAGIYNSINGGGSNGGQIWRSDTGNQGDWQKVASGGFTSTNNADMWLLVLTPKSWT